MGFREFFKFNSRKTILFFILFLFLPMPLYLVIVVGLTPTINLFFEIFITLGFNIIFGIYFINFILNILLLHLISCIIYWIISSIFKNHTNQWTIIITLSLILLALSFFPIYFIGTAGGYNGWENIIDIIKSIINSLLR